MDVFVQNSPKDQIIKKFHRKPKLIKTDLKVKKAQPKEIWYMNQSLASLFLKTETIMILSSSKNRTNYDMILSKLVGMMR